MDRIKPELGSIQETMLIPLYGRALDAHSRRSVLGDRLAADLVERIDYDFAKIGGPSLPGMVLRTAIFDGWVRKFIDANPIGTIIEIGTGLNTRFDRLDNGRVHWFDLDLPDSISLRQRLLGESRRCRTIAGSALHDDWYDEVGSTPGPYLFVVEAVFPYFQAEQVHGVIDALRVRFGGALIAFDTAGALMIQNQHRSRVMKAIAARMQWAVERPISLEAWGMQLLDSRTLARPQPEVGRNWPIRYKAGLALLGGLAPSVVNAYNFNLFKLRS